MANYIITGGPCSGKTTTIAALRSHGYTCYDEIARQVIKEEIENDSHALPWRDNIAFSDIVLGRMKLLLSASPDDHPVFFDRGIPDLIGYMAFHKNVIPSKYTSEIANSSYDQHVFFLENDESIYKKDTERIESFAEACQISAFLKQTYISYGYTIISIPFGSIEKRVKSITHTLIHKASSF